MADVVLPVIGAAVGFVVGGPQGAMMGAQIGMMAASAFTRVKLPTQEGPRLADLRGQTSTYGGNIPKLYDTMRIAGNVIWSTDIKEVKVESTQNGGGKGGGGCTSQTSITYEYYITLAIALCEGEIDAITRVWADAKILTEDILLSNQGKYNVHLGSEDQDVDDIMAKYIDSSILPAYRGTTYVVIEDFPLGDYGNRIPNFSFEVRRSIRFTPALEDKITDIVMIPGAGEMVYGTEVTTKQDGFFWSFNNRFIPSGDIQNINMHNYEGKADVLLSLDNMQKILPNLEWVAVVVT